MTAILDAREDTIRAAMDALASTITEAPHVERVNADAFITELTDLALDLYQRWPTTAPTVDMRNLLALLTRVRDAYTKGEVEKLDLALVGMRTVLAQLMRQKRLGQIENPGEALASLEAALEGWSTEELAHILGTQPRVLSNWRSGTTPRKAALERLQLVAELVAELRTAMTARGVRMWFDNPVPQLGEQSPLQVLNADGADARVTLVKFVHGSLR